MNDQANTQGTSNCGSVLVGFALGAVVGAGLALLLAPENGKKTRERLASTAKRWSKSAGDTLEDARDRMVELGTDAKSAIKAGKDAFQQDLATREPRSERRTSDTTVPGLNAVKRTHEEAVR